MTNDWEIDLAPNWQNPPNIVLDILVSVTSTFSYSATVTGPGIEDGVTINNFSGFKAQFLKQGIKVPLTNYQPGNEIKYTVSITCNTTYNAIVNEGPPLGNKGTSTKPVPVAVQSAVFCNDSGSDNDWNDLVCTLTMYSDSTD